jgi:predicted transcriptional regulator
MSAAKEKMIEIINRQPEDSSYDEILQELSFISMVNKGLEDAKAGHDISHEELKKEIENW